MVCACYTADVMAEARSPVHRYSIATLAIIAGAAVQVICHQVIGATPPSAAIFLLGIGFSAWYGGFGPGLLAMILC